MTLSGHRDVSRQQEIDRYRKRQLHRVSAVVIPRSQNEYLLGGGNGRDSARTLRSSSSGWVPYHSAVCGWPGGDAGELWRIWQVELARGSEGVGRGEKVRSECKGGELYAEVGALAGGAR